MPRKTIPNRKFRVHQRKDVRYVMRTLQFIEEGRGPPESTKKKVKS